MNGVGDNYAIISIKVAVEKSFLILHLPKRQTYLVQMITKLTFIE